MKKNRKLAAILIFAISTPSLSAGWVTDNISHVAVASGNGCIKLNNNQVIQVDLNTAAGRSEFSLAMTAKVSNKKLKVYQTDGALVGGCNTGTTIKPHNSLRLVD